MNPDEKTVLVPPDESECDWGTSAENENSDLVGEDAVPEGDGA